MRSPACFPGTRTYRPDAPPPFFAVNPMFAPERETRESVAEGIGHLCLAWVSSPPPAAQIRVLLSYGDVISVRLSGKLAKSKWLSLVTVVS